jgi:hypothetical protein
MSQTEALPTYPDFLAMPSTGSRTGVLEPVLIRVPQVHLLVPRSDLPHSWPPGRPTQRLNVNPPRRRLKREVRLAVCTILALLPLSLAWSHCVAPSHGERLAHRLLALPGQVIPRQAPATAADRPAGWPSPRPAVVLSVEPIGVAGDPELEAPVVLPGYLLPDDIHEEPAHEGS